MTGASTETASECIVFRAQKLAQRPAPWKNINTIIEGKLYLSNLVATRTKRSLAERSIIHVLSVFQDAIPADMPQSGIHHMRIAVKDVDYTDLLIHLPSAFPNRTAGASLILVLAITYMIYRFWPMRMTYILVAFMRETEKLYYDAVEAGELPGDVHTEEKLLR
ncbi:hypothetical protein C8J57DRAFT_1536175 [Mycena rebaudengoi]|nr:hypothetical protein C8J57DRAFT_1536175 [Mycena rebaudengoi]